MTPAELSSMVTSFAALLAAGGWIANMGIKAAERRKTEAEARALEIDAGGERTVRIFGVAEQMIERLQAEITRMRLDRDAFEKEHREREASCQEQLRAVRDRLVILERRPPGVDSGA